MSDPFTPQRRAQIEAMRVAFEAEGWGTGEPSDADDMARSDAIMDFALTAALAAASPKGGVRIRVAVAMDKKGGHKAIVIRDGAEEDAWEQLHAWQYDRRAAILTAPIRPPDIEEIAADVEGVG